MLKHKQLIWQHKCGKFLRAALSVKSVNMNKTTAFLKMGKGYEQTMHKKRKRKQMKIK